MDGFIQFLRDNWKFLLEISIPLISFIVLLIAKRVKVNIPTATITSVLCQLPLWINEAESLGVSGKEKLEYVFTKAVNVIVNETGLSYGIVCRAYGNELIADIEKILSTPQKKGD